MSAHSFRRDDDLPVDWCVTPGLTGYDAAVTQMEQRVQGILEGRQPELVWLVEHPALYTAGISARPSDLLDARRLPVHASGRGGQYTYHGPGQRVVYVMLDLNRRQKDVRQFVGALEGWAIDSLATFGLQGQIRPGRVGVWIERKGPGWQREDKIAAIGIKLRRWVSFHGLSINIEPDLGHYDGIVPCGQTAHGVTSLVDLGRPVTMDEVDAALKSAFERRFGLTCPCVPL